jgi:hypothetical protein
MLFKKQNQKIDSKVELNSVCQALEEITNYIVLLKQIQKTTTYDLNSEIEKAKYAQALLRYSYFREYKGWRWYNASI